MYIRYVLWFLSLYMTTVWQKKTRNLVIKFNVAFVPFILGSLKTFPKHNFWLDFHKCSVNIFILLYHWLSVRGNSKMMHGWMLFYMPDCDEKKSLAVSTITASLCFNYMMCRALLTGVICDGSVTGEFSWYTSLYKRCLYSQRHYRWLRYDYHVCYSWYS